MQFTGKQLEMLLVENDSINKHTKLLYFICIWKYFLTTFSTWNRDFLDICLLESLVFIMFGKLIWIFNKLKYKLASLKSWLFWILKFKCIFLLCD